MTRYKIKLLMVSVFCFASNLILPAQENKYLNFLDSLEKRADVIELSLQKLGKSRDLKYITARRDLDHTLFLKEYYQYIYDEDLDNAKILTEQRKNRSKLRNDQTSVKFYDKYIDEIYKRIREQKLYYQELFSKEKNYIKLFNQYTKTGTIDDLERLKRKTELAIKYANENQLENSVNFLTDYMNYIDALIFDFHSEYDLKKLTSNKKTFEDILNPLIESDTLGSYEEAKFITEKCYSYASKTNSILDTFFFSMQLKKVISATSDYFDRLGNKVLLSELADGCISGRLDTLNRIGIYKWHNQIVIINEIKFQFNDPSVKKGEAIMLANQLLFNYIRINIKTKNAVNLKIQKTFFIPYKSNSSVKNFVYNYETNRWQYMLCYKLDENDYFTESVIKFMPPLKFNEEKNENSNLNTVLTGNIN